MIARFSFLAALTLAATSAFSQQLVVNVDVGAGAGVYSGQGAIADPGNDFWNEVNGAGANLIASDGVTVTGVSVNITSQGSFSFGNPNALLGDYQFVSGFGTPTGDITISGLQPNTNHLVYVFSAGDQLDQAGVITLSGVVGCTTGSLSDQLLEGPNYTIIDVVSDGAGVISGMFEAFNTAGAINGLQITEGTLPSQVLRIEGAESPQVRSPGDAMPVTLSFNDEVTLSTAGAAQITLDVDGTLVVATHVGASSGTSLTFSALAPSVTTVDIAVVADSLQLLGGATLLDSDLVPVDLTHPEVVLPNDQISTVGLSVYPQLDPLLASKHYSFRVREVGGTWQAPFAWFTKCVDAPTAEFGYYADQIGGWSHTYCNFEMANNVPVEVEITRLDPVSLTPIDIATAVPHPRRSVKSWRVEDGKAYVLLERPALFAVDIDGQHDNYVTPTGPLLNEDALHGVSVFANPIIVDKPDLSDPSVFAVTPGDPVPDDGPWTTLYFLPGVHQLHTGTWGFGDGFQLRSGRSYYLPGDALVHGNFTNGEDSNNAQGIRIFGHGTLSGERIDHPTELGILSFADQEQSGPIRIGGGAKGCRVEGVTMADPPYHACTLKSGYNARPEDFNYIRWSKVLGWRANSDGITPNGSTYLEDCFLRTQDDGTYITGLGIRRMVYWHDVNGMPLRCSQLIKFNDAARKEPCYVEDIDVIYARTFFGSGSGRSVIGYPDPDSFYPGVDASTVVFRNINVEDRLSTRTLFGWGLNEGSGLLGAPQPIFGVRFENVRSAAPNLDGDPDVFFGDSDAPIAGLIFDNVTLGGQHYDDIGDFGTNGFVSGLVFENVAPETMTYLNTSGYGKWYLRNDWDTSVEPANNDIVEHTAVAGVLTVDAFAYAGVLNVGHASTATVVVEDGGQLAVTSSVSIGAAGSGNGVVDLRGGTLQIDNPSGAGLSVGNGVLNIGRGLLVWAGDRISDVQSLQAANALSFSSGRDSLGASSAQRILIAQEGSSCLYADYDSVADRTTVFVVTPTVFGDGCGAPALTFTPDANGKPFLGQTASATVSNAPTAIGGVFLGFSNELLGGLPLPVPLDLLGLSGCTLLQSAEVSGLPVTPVAAGTMQFSLAIPNDPTLVDSRVYLQAFVAAPGVNPGGLVLSNGIEWRIEGV